MKYSVKKITAVSVYKASGVWKVGNLKAITQKDITDGVTEYVVCSGKKYFATTTSLREAKENAAIRNIKYYETMKYLAWQELKEISGSSPSDNRVELTTGSVQHLSEIITNYRV